MSENVSILSACAMAVSVATDDEMTLDRDFSTAKAVIRKIIDLTPSHHTVDELKRILDGGGGGVVMRPHEGGEVTETKADPSAKSALCGEATGSYQPGFFDRLQVLQLANGDPVVAEEAWAWLIKREPEQS